MHVRGRPSVAFDEQGVIFAVAMDRGVLKLFDVRTYSQVKENNGNCLINSKILHLGYSFHRK